MICLLDLDGVICDFYKHWFNLRNLPFPELFKNEDLCVHHDISLEDFCQGLTTEWWASMPWMEDGKEILTLLEQKFTPANIFICTSDGVEDSASAAAGKVKWIKKHLPDYINRYCIVQAKWLLARHDAVLVDDRRHNIDWFSAKGGQTIWVPRPWNDAFGDPISTIKKELKLIH